MMKSNFSVDLDPNTCESLAHLMGKFPKKSRNGVIRHIINTYDPEENLVGRVEALTRLMKTYEKTITELERDIELILRRG